MDKLYERKIRVFEFEINGMERKKDRFMEIGKCYLRIFVVSGRNNCVNYDQ
jgi:hypothetical protein